MNSKNMCRALVIILLLSTFLDGCQKNHKENIVKEEQKNTLVWKDFSPYIQEFNKNDVELYTQYFPNDKAEEFLKNNIPYFNCPDKELEKTYYFRWWTFRKHIKNTEDGFVITEFLPDVSWAGKYNTINCPAGYHFYEGRWLRNQNYLADYANFWFKGGGSLRSYSFWAPNSILAFASVHQNKKLVTELLPFFVENYDGWENERLGDDGLFWQFDNRDGMEVSVGGSGKRATINSYMIGDAAAIAEIARMAGNKALEETYSQKGSTLKNLLLSKLWDADAQFFKTLPLTPEEYNKLVDKRYSDSFSLIKKDSLSLVDVRELHGYTPWYFSIPEDKHSVAWKFLLSNEGFKAPYGPTTAEQKHPGFKVVYEGHACQWNGPGWPFATSVTLKAMGNLLRDYNQSVISKNDFVNQLLTYSNSHRRINERGKKLCWIDENLNPFTGDWISRTMLKARGHEPEERGKDYNHSEFCDIVISDLIGIQPSMDNTLTVNPLVPDNYWNWFCLDRVKYHDKEITIIWDKNGQKYMKGQGFSIFVNGELKHNSKKVEKITIQI
ncbi:MAG: MGH1-like glycoside hydrolase domain-containing protein [Draconibacterium sp.]